MLERYSTAQRGCEHCDNRRSSEFVRLIYSLLLITDMGEIVHYPRETEPCNYCNGTAHMIEEMAADYTAYGMECESCGRITAI